MRKLKHAEVAPTREAILKSQKHRCPLCDGRMTKAGIKDPVLDHCHKHGHIRGVLCRNCNQMEGKIKNSANRAKNKLTYEEWLKNLSAYWELHSTPQVPLLHPTFKTPEDKRLAANKKARERRAKLKASK